jgi:hypothetical protein
MASVTATPVGIGFKLQCNGCGITVIANTAQQDRQFQLAHMRCPELRPAAETHYGLGDIIAAVAAPIARIFRRDPHCAPCEERKQLANATFPKVWRRR